MRELKTHCVHGHDLSVTRRLSRDTTRVGSTYCEECRRLWEMNKRLRLAGWTMERFTELLASQEGKCAICGDCLDKKWGANADHDHVTLTPRGILCSKCNKALGLFADDPVLLRAAAAYIESYA